MPECDPPLDAESLRSALMGGRIAPVYQPIVSLRNGRIVAVEALARWQKPDGVDLIPRDFVPVAEAEGLSAMLSLTILERAVQEWRLLPAEWRHLAMHVNVSASLISDLAFGSAVRGQAADAGRGFELVLEITESQPLSEEAETRRAMEMLRQDGIGFILDDWGAGHAAGLRLPDLPLSGVKLDRALVAAATSSTGRLRVRERIAIAHAADLPVVAEGIADLDLLRALKGLNCDAGQGHYICPPLPLSGVIDYLAVSSDDAVLGFLNGSYSTPST